MLCRQLWGLLEPALNKHTASRRLQENHHCPLRVRRTKKGNAAFHSLSASSASSGRSCHSKDNQETSVRMPSPAKGCDLRVGGVFVSSQRDLCERPLERRLFPLATSDLPLDRKPAACSLRAARKLAGVVERKGGFLLQSQKVPLKVFWESGSCCMSQLHPGGL